MAAQEPLTESLQEAVLAVLAFDQKFGALVAAQVSPEHFDGAYHDIAAAVISYRKRYSKPPGRTHLEDLFSRAKLDPSDRKTHAFRRTLLNLAALAENINAEYIASRTQDHIRSQKLKTALLQANERYLQGGDDAVQEVEGILQGALRFRETTLDAGTFLHQIERSSLFAPKEDERVFVPLGIPELDKVGIGPTAKRLMLYIGPKSSGKSWASVHVGKQALIQKYKVVHIVLEMEEHPELLDRYLQSFFGLATRPDAYIKTNFELDDLGRFVSFKSRKVKPKLDFTDPAVKKWLRNKVGAGGTRFERLVLKAFPSGSLTMAGLRGYLDYLELTQKFIPNVLVVDYPDLMRHDHRDLRLSLSRTFVELRGLAAERNLAVFTPTQSGRDSLGARKVRGRNVTEDVSKLFTADTVLAFSQTEAEERHGLGRLFVEYARNAPKGMEYLLSQSYATGQYVLQSVPLYGSEYWEQLKEVSGEDAFIGAEPWE